MNKTKPVGTALDSGNVTENISASEAILVPSSAQVLPRSPFSESKKGGTF
jgi:hypothetical protein